MSTEPAPAGIPAHLLARGQEKAPRLLEKSARLLVLGSLLPWLGAELGGVGALENSALKLGLLAACGLISKAGAHLMDRWRVLGALLIAALLVVQYFTFHELFLLGESLTLLLGGLTLVHLRNYAKGGKFNPLYPLLFGGCTVGGVFALIGRVRAQQWFAALGCAIVTTAGVLAVYTIAVAMVQAKRDGDLKKAAALEARKQARESAKAAATGREPMA